MLGFHPQTCSEKSYVTTTCIPLSFWRAVVLSFAFAKQLNLFSIDFLNRETEMLWCYGMIKCSSFRVASESMGEVLLSTFNTIIRNTEKLFLIIPSLILISGTNWKVLKWRTKLSRLRCGTCTFKPGVVEGWAREMMTASAQSWCISDCFFGCVDAGALLLLPFL